MRIRNQAILITLTLAALGAAEVSAQGRHGQRGWRRCGNCQSLRVQLGQFAPDGESRYWADKEFDFFGSADDFDDVGLIVDYVRALGPRLGLMLSGSVYDAEQRTSYREFVGPAGEEIEHDTLLETASLTAGLLLHLARRDALVSPYVGAGGGLYLYNLTEDGEFIDFGTDLEIFDARFETEGETFGYYLQAGLEVPVSPNWSIFGDARWQKAEDDLGDDFEGLGDLDLGGLWLTLGAAFNF